MWADHNRHSTETDTEEKQLNYKVVQWNNKGIILRIIFILLSLVDSGLHHLAVSLITEIYREFFK